MKDYETLVRDIIQEENELKDRIMNLEYFMMTEDYQKISERQKRLLLQQHAAMYNYKNCLISRVLQIRFEHKENEGKDCEPEPEKEERLEPHVFSAMEYEAHKRAEKCNTCKHQVRRYRSPTESALFCDCKITCDAGSQWEAKEEEPEVKEDGTPTDKR